MASVTVPRGVLIALVATLLVCLGLTAFLAGRASAPAATTGTVLAPPAAVATPGAAAEPYARTLPQAEPVPAAGLAAPQPPAETPAPAGVVPSLAPAAPADGARVARYVQEMETAQASAKYWDDPQALAGSLVQSLGKGDRSGIDQLLAATRGAHERMQAIDVPADCAEHHRRSLDLVAQGASMLDAIAGGVTSGDVDGLTAFPARARQLEADAKDVDALAVRIKQRYGIS
ncbi:MAG: hypothetical protein ABW221_17730 [Vicinamibacteria bacterium]